MKAPWTIGQRKKIGHHHNSHPDCNPGWNQQPMALVVRALLSKMVGRLPSSRKASLYLPSQWWPIHMECIVRFGVVMTFIWQKVRLPGSPFSRVPGGAARQNR